MNQQYHITKSVIDLALIQEIERKTLKQFETIGYNSANWSTLTIDQLSNYEKVNRLWVAVHGNKPVGFAVVDIYDEFTHLEELDVDPKYQRKGIASALLQEIINWSKQHNFKAITLRTFKTTPWSFNLYKKFGFKIMDEKQVHIETLITNEKKLNLPVKDRITMIKYVHI